jgi:hypothetical protein
MELSGRMEEAMRQLSWTPVRMGSSYCSPACGGGCTHDKFRAATSLAEKVAGQLNRLDPEGKWEPNVWENLGWYSSVTSEVRNVAVYPPSHSWESSYTALIRSGSQFAGSGNTAEKAVLDLCRHVQAACEALGQVLSGISKFQKSS